MTSCSSPSVSSSLASLDVRLAGLLSFFPFLRPLLLLILLDRPIHGVVGAVHIHFVSLPSLLTTPRLAAVGVLVVGADCGRE